jgi:peptidoglycan glycosyltransferase
MTKQIRRVATIMLVLFGMMFVNLNLIQIVRGPELSDHPANRRLLVLEYENRRGAIVVGDTEIARSVETDGDLKFLRVYDEPGRYAHLTGFHSFVLSRSGLESAMNTELTGAPSEVLAENLAELLGDRAVIGNTVRLTIDPNVQAAAQRALGDRVGAVVAVDPSTGAILASYSNPTYDPNVLSAHNASEVLDAWDALRVQDNRPLLDRVTRDRFPPGSTFKVLVAAAALERGLSPETRFEDAAEYQLPQSNSVLGNYSPGPCADGGTISLADAIRVSCNTVFARLGVDLGAEALIDIATKFGYNRPIPYELPTVESVIPTDLDPPSTALSAIGQRDVRVTPLHAAMIIASIANGGTMLKPYVVADVLDPSGRSVSGPQDGPWQSDGFSEQPVSPRTAQLLQEMLVQVVERGTGRAAAIPGVRVAGKTGTAELPDQTPTVWFLGFADTRVAVAVVLPNAGDGATGGRDAAPIARAVMEAALS